MGPLFPSQTGQNGLIEYKKKNGNQHAIKLPMIKPKIKVALRSFLRAKFFFAFSASCSGVNLGLTGEAGCGLLLGSGALASELPQVEFGPTET